MENLKSKPKETETISNSKISKFIKERWINLNVKLFDCIQKRKLRKAILNDNYNKIYELILNYEKIAGPNEESQNIKDYAKYNMINENFINSAIMQKI